MNEEQILNEIENVKNAMNDEHLCEGTANTFSRVSGYYRAVENFNESKVQEYKDRQNSDIEKVA